MPVVQKQKAINSFWGRQSLLFPKTKFLKEINISFAGYFIKQDGAVEHPGCQLHSKLSCNVMTAKVLKKANARLKILYRQSRYLNPAFRRLLCNELIQPHFDYGYSSRFLF